MISRWVDLAASFAGDIDGFITLIFVIVGFWFLLAEGIFFYFIFKFRAKGGKKAKYVSGEKKEEKRWVTIPHLLVLVCDVVIIVFAIKVWIHVKQDLPQAEETVRITTQQWAWTFTHPGADGKLDTEDDIRTVDELRVKVGTIYHFKLESRDVLHSFSVPAFRLKQDAVPGRVITGWFKPTKTGVYDVQCAEMCGIGHGLMPAKVVIETPADHDAWIAAQPRNAVAQASGD